MNITHLLPVYHVHELEARNTEPAIRGSAAKDHKVSLRILWKVWDNTKNITLGETVKLEKICVLGLGYIGLPTASTFASHAIKVVGVDVNPHVVQSLQKGELHIYEPGLRTIVLSAVQSGNLVIGSQPEAADAFIIAVPTPFKEEKKRILLLSNPQQNPLFHSCAKEIW